MKTLSREEFQKKYGEVGVEMLSKTAPAQKTTFSERTKAAASSGVSKMKDAFAESKAGRNPISTGAKLAAGAIETVTSPITAAVQPVIEPTLGAGIEYAADKISDIPAVQEFAGSKAGEVTSNVVEDVANINTIASAVAGLVEAPALISRVQNATRGSFGTIDDAIRGRVSAVKDPKMVNRVTEFLANDIDGKAATVLKETPTAKFDKYIKVAQEASVDPRKLTPYDIAGEEAQNALIALDKRMSGIGQQKSSVIQKSKVGRIDMTGDVRDALRSIYKTFKNPEGADKTLIERVTAKLKTASRLQDVDKVIDEVQGIIYADARNTTLSLGPKVTQQLRGIVEELNSKVKTKAGKLYSDLNAKYSNYIKVRDYLDKALGEEVNGVAIRGGSLVKRFFSPSDGGTKTMLEFLKKELNIDLAQDIVAARFAMEVFDDARARALLEGIPKTPAGLVDKAIDFAVDKTGIGRSVQESLRQGEIRKARNLTQ